MAKEEYEIEIDAHGKVTVRTIGIKGPKCIDAAQFFVELLGREEASELTGEYYEAEADVNVEDTLNIYNKFDH